MTTTNSRQLILEICWWAFTAVLTILVLLPIRNQIPQFPFFVYNGVAVVVAITMTRYLFSLHINWMRRLFMVQGFLIFLMIPTLFYIGQGLNAYITYLDNNGPDVLINHLSLESGQQMKSYLNSEYYFFGVWAIIAGVIFPFRVIYHIWKNYKSTVRR